MHPSESGLPRRLEDLSFTAFRMDADGYGLGWSLPSVHESIQDV